MPNQPPAVTNPAVLVVRPQDGDAVFVCGLRCVAEIDLARLRVGRLATSPVDVLTELTLDIPGAVTQSVIIHPGYVEKTHVLADGVTARSVWLAVWDKPCFAVWWTIDNASGAEYVAQVQVEAQFNVNYISKFRLYPNDRANVDGDRLVVTDSQYPDLCAIAGMNPAWESCAVGPTSAPSPDQMRLDSPTQVKAMFQGRLSVTPSTSRSSVIAVGGGNQSGVVDEAVREVLANPQAVHARTQTRWDQAASDGVILDTPNARLNEFFLQSKLWGHRDTRLVPVGAPFDLNRNDNADVMALTASPDYHGIFANDNGQSCWEYGCLGPAFYPVLNNTLEVLYRYGTPESVEVDPFGATGRPWLSPLRIGERPQWVMGACALILWSGQYVDPLWPRIQAVLARFAADDADGDWLDDYSNSTFPEQPDPGPYRHEMLYASAFWYRAFVEAEKVARLVADGARAAEYAANAQHIAQAVESKFGTEFGYASWLDVEHRQHPHRGHNMVLPLQYEMASPERAETAFATLLHSAMRSENGPLAIEPGYPLDGAAHAWTFMRWNLVHALYRYGQTEEATGLLLKWADQEAGLYYQAPEGFPTITGVTGKGYSWSAGRALRAILFGLFGLGLRANGFTLLPRLPQGWPRMSLSGLSFRGATYDVMVERGAPAGTWLDGEWVRDGLIPPDPSRSRHQITVGV